MKRCDYCKQRLIQKESKVCPACKKYTAAWKNFLKDSGIYIAIVAFIAASWNNFYDLYSSLAWKNKLKVIQVDFFDNSVFYNGSSKPIFVERMEYFIDQFGVKKLDTTEVQKIIPPYSYLNTVSSKTKIGFKRQFKECCDTDKIRKKIENSSIHNDFHIRMFNSSHHLIVKLKRPDVIAPTFIESKIKIFFLKNDESHAVTLEGTGFIVETDHNHPIRSSL